MDAFFFFAGYTIDIMKGGERNEKAKKIGVRVWPTVFGCCWHLYRCRYRCPVYGLDGRCYSGSYDWHQRRRNRYLARVFVAEVICFEAMRYSRGLLAFRIMCTHLYRKEVTDMTISDAVLFTIIGFSWGMLFTMLAERISGGRFIEIFFPRPRAEIIMTSFEDVTEEDDEEN